MKAGSVGATGRDERPTSGGPAARRADPVRRDADLVTPDGLARHVFRAMGTEVTVLLPEPVRHEAARVEALFARWEAVLTRFHPDSELSRLNASSGRTVPVSPLLFDVVETAVRAARATGGLFDPTLLPHLVAAGYDRTFEEIQRDEGPRARSGRREAAAFAAGQSMPHAQPPVGAWRRIELDRSRQTVRLPEGAAIDLGGIAKGMAVDAALDELVRAGATPAAVDAGGDLAVHGLPPDHDAWPIRVELPHDSRTIAIRGGALATSGVSRRQWWRGGELRHHIIDPRTGLPAASDTWSATVAAATSAQAEVAAKALFLLGQRGGGLFLLRHGLTGLLVATDGSQVALGGWDMGDDRREPRAIRAEREPAA